MDNFLLVDGSSLLHRAFYALPLLSTQKGEYTNAVYGFVMMLNKIIEIEHPQYLCVCFDYHGIEHRNDKYCKQYGNAGNFYTIGLYHWYEYRRKHPNGSLDALCVDDRSYWIDYTASIFYQCLYVWRKGMAARKLCV